MRQAFEKKQKNNTCTLCMFAAWSRLLWGFHAPADDTQRVSRLFAFGTNQPEVGIWRLAGQVGRSVGRLASLFSHRSAAAKSKGAFETALGRIIASVCQNLHPFVEAAAKSVNRMGLKAKARLN